MNNFKDGYKDTPLGWIPKDWELIELKYISQFKNGLNFGKESKGQGLKIIGVGDFQENFSIEYDKLEKINVHNNISEEYYLKNDDLLFVRSNGNKELIGRTLFIKDLTEKISHSGFTIRARITSKKVLPFYIVILFKSPLIKKWIQKNGGGTNISNLSQDILGELLIPLPPIQEQLSISKLYNTWNEAIQNTSKIIKLKEEQRNWLMQKLLTGKKRLKGFKDAWKKTVARDFLCLRSEQCINDKVIPLFSLTIEHGITEKSARYEREFLVKDKGVKKYKIVYPNDIVFNPANLRWGAIAKHNRPYKVLLSPIYEVMSVNDKYNADFINYLVSSPQQITYYASIIEGTLIERMAVKADTFLSIKYLIPEYEEQASIAEVLKAADKEIQILKNKVEQMEEQKKGLMQQLLTGKRRLNSINTKN